MPQESLFDVTAVSALTADPVYAASTVLKPEPQVVIVATLSLARLSLYQTEFNGVETPPWSGSPASPVAPTVLPVNVPPPLTLMRVDPVVVDGHERHVQRERPDRAPVAVDRDRVERAGVGGEGDRALLAA